MIQRYKMFSNVDPVTSVDFNNFGEFRLLSGSEQRVLWVVEISSDAADTGIEYTKEQLAPTTKNADGSWNTLIPNVVWRRFEYDPTIHRSQS